MIWLQKRMKIVMGTTRRKKTTAKWDMMLSAAEDHRSKKRWKLREGLETDDQAKIEAVGN